MGGHYPPETMLGESALASEIGVSRTPVRTALTRLQDEGWVKIYPKRGALVVGLSDREVEDLIEACLMFQAIAVQRADENSLKLLADSLEDQVSVQEEHLQKRDLRAFIEATLTYHRAFVAAAGNNVLLEFVDRLRNRQRYLLISHGEGLLARCDEIIAEHRILIEDLRDGNIPAFSEHLRKHLSDSYGKDLAPLGLTSLDSRQNSGSTGA